MAVYRNVRRLIAKIDHGRRSSAPAIQQRHTATENLDDAIGSAMDTVTEMEACMQKAREMQELSVKKHSAKERRELLLALLMRHRRRHAGEVTEARRQEAFEFRAVIGGCGGASFTRADAELVSGPSSTPRTMKQMVEDKINRMAIGMVYGNVRGNSGMQRARSVGRIFGGTFLPSPLKCRDEKHRQRRSLRRSISKKSLKRERKKEPAMFLLYSIVTTAEMHALIDETAFVDEEVAPVVFRPRWQGSA
jgi:hypothetical protein